MSVMNEYEGSQLYCVLRHVGPEQDIVLTTFPFTIGRSMECHHCIKRVSISRVHIVISKDDSGLSISNISSVNYVKVNHQKIDRQLLVDGDLVSISGMRYRYLEDIHVDDLSVPESVPVAPETKVRKRVTTTAALLGAALVLLVSSYLWLKPTSTKPLVMSAVNSTTVLTDIVRVIETPDPVYIPLVIVSNSDKNGTDELSTSSIKIQTDVYLDEKLSYYRNGLIAFQLAEYDKAFSYWRRYLGSNKPDKKLADKIKKYIVSIYTLRAQHASGNSNHRDAYTYWRKINRLLSDTKSRNALIKIEAIYSALVTRASELQLTQPDEARNVWQALVNQTPNDHLWHHKALSKLRQADNKYGEK